MQPDKKKNKNMRVFLLTIIVTLLAACASQPAEKSKPNPSREVISQASILELNGQIAQSLSTLSKFLNDNPDDYYVRLTYARTLMKMNNYSEAEREYETLAISQPNKYEVIYPLALLAVKKHEYKIASKYLRRLSQQDLSVIYLQATIAEALEQYDVAIMLFTEIKSGHYELVSHYRAAVLIAKTRTLQKGLVKLRRFKPFGKDQKQQFDLMEADLLIETGHPQKAFDYYTSRLKADPDNHKLLYKRAIVAEQLNQIPIVIKDLAYIIEKNPRNADALNLLGFTIAEKVNNLSDSLTLVQRAYDLDPNNPSILSSLGWINYRLGNDDKAINYLRRAMDGATTAKIAVQYAEVLWNNGDRNQAQQVLTQAKRQFPKDKTLNVTTDQFAGR